jgi:hypothetical protein
MKTDAAENCKSGIEFSMQNILMARVYGAMAENL